MGTFGVIQLSRDGSYWDVNSAGIFKKKYLRRKPEVFTRPGLEPDTNTDTSGVDNGQANGVTTPAGNTPQSSDGKGRVNSSTAQGKGVKDAENQSRNPVQAEDKKKKGNTLQTAASKPHGGIALYRDILANVLISDGKDRENRSTKQGKGYGNTKEEVWSASEEQNKQSATDNTLRAADKSDNPTVPNGNVSNSSVGKDSENPSTKQGKGVNDAENQSRNAVQAAREAAVERRKAESVQQDGTAEAVAGGSEDAGRSERGTEETPTLTHDEAISLIARMEERYCEPPH